MARPLRGGGGVKGRAIKENAIFKKKEIMRGFYLYTLYMTIWIILWTLSLNICIF